MLLRLRQQAKHRKEQNYRSGAETICYPLDEAMQRPLFPDLT